MYFHIDSDSGKRIEGWILPDNPSHVPSIVVMIDGEHRFTVQAKVLRPPFLEQGLHRTGVCGFVIDQSIVPSLAKTETVELLDADTNVRIYRRPPLGELANARLFRLELQLLRNAALNQALDRLFHMPFTRLEHVPEETAQAIIGVIYPASVYVTGRTLFRVHEPVLRYWNYKFCAYLRDPVEEMAESLLVLSWAASKPPESVRGIFTNSHARLLDAMDATAFSNPAQLEKWLIGLSKEARAPLTDPATRLLASTSIDDRLGPNAVADALDTLGSFDVVGFRDDIPRFYAMLSGILDRDIEHQAPSTVAPRVEELTQQLRGWPVVDDLLSADLELYAAAREAYDVALKRFELDTQYGSPATFRRNAKKS